MYTIDSPWRLAMSEKPQKIKTRYKTPSVVSKQVQFIMTTLGSPITQGVTYGPREAPRRESSDT